VPTPHPTDGNKSVAGCGFVADYLREDPEFADLAR
jgi:hypothetical protein